MKKLNFTEKSTKAANTILHAQEKEAPESGPIAELADDQYYKRLMADPALRERFLQNFSNEYHHLDLRILISLHRMQKKEENNDTKQLRHAKFMEKIIAEEKDKFIKQFEDEWGYKPQWSDLPDLFMRSGRISDISSAETVGNGQGIMAGYTPFAAIIASRPFDSLPEPLMNYVCALIRSDLFTKHEADVFESIYLSKNTTMTEAARDLNISASRISQIHKRIIIKLRSDVELTRRVRIVNVKARTIEPVVPKA